MSAGLWMAVLLSSTPASAVDMKPLGPAPDLAVLPFTTSGEVPEKTRTQLQTHVVYWLRRWGQPVDDPQQMQARVDPERARALQDCAEQSDKCPVEGTPYAAVLSGEVSTGATGWRVTLTVTGADDGSRWTTMVVTESTGQDLYNPLIDATKDITIAVAKHTSRPVNVEPSTRPYATVPFVAGGISLGTGVLFLILAGSEQAQLPSGTQSLRAAVSTRNTANTYAAVGYTLTAVGVAGLILGLVLYQPGAYPPEPAVSLSVDPARGMVLVGGRFP